MNSCAITDFESTQPYFAELSRVIAHLPHDRIEEVCDVLFDAYQSGKLVILFGNGGSASLASHFVCDLAKGTAKAAGDGKRFRAVSLTDNIPLLTAWANDTDYDQVFCEQLVNLASPGDVAFAVSGSGNSPNVLKALREARKIGLTTVGITGYQGGKMRDLCDFVVVVPSDNMQIIEDVHLSLAHSLFSVLYNRIRQAARSTKAVAAGARA